jgi:hypothetical protein
MNRAARLTWNAVRGIFLAIYESYRLGGRTFLIAPAIVAIAVLPEFIQHVVEIQLGMFDSMEAARRLANDPLRWGFGYAKIAGLVLAILLTTRLWACDGSVRRALLIPPGVLLRTVGALAVTLLIGLGLDYLAKLLPPLPGAALALVSAILQAGMTAWTVAQLIEDRTMTLRRALTTHLPTAALLFLLFFAAMAPAQLLHLANHRMALGQPDALVWPLMLFDSLLVGLMAALAGAGLFVAMRAGPTWRGWTRTPGSAA